jgi:hypothetical protein
MSPEINPLMVVAYFVQLGFYALGAIAFWKYIREKK